MSSFERALRLLPLHCICSELNYPHPHCTRCNLALRWVPARVRWEHLPSASEAPNWTPHEAQTLADQPEFYTWNERDE